MPIKAGYYTFSDQSFNLNDVKDPGFIQAYNEWVSKPGRARGASFSYNGVDYGAPAVTYHDALGTGDTRQTIRAVSFADDDGLFGLGGVVGQFGDLFKELGPIGVILGNAIAPGLGTALGVITAIDEGADPTDIAKNIAVGELVNQLDVGSNITDSSVAADLVDNTLKGLLTGQDLDKALTNSVVSSVAGEVTNQTKDDFQADIENVLDSAASTPVSDYLSDVNDVLDMPVTSEPVSGQDLAADAVPGNTIDDIINVLPPLTEPQLPPAPPATEPGLTKAQVETLIKTALAATAADQVINQPETKPPGFDIVPVPTEWKSPTYDQTFTPVDLDSIFKNLQGTQYQWKPRPDITGGAYMGSPVNISDIVNNIMSAELTPTTMPSQITNAVGGILGPTATR